MDPNKLTDAVARAGGRIRIIGIALVVLGALAIYSPQISGMTISVIVGILLILSGIARTTFAWLAIGWGPAVLRFAMGVISIIAGAYMIVQPGVGSQALAIVLMIYLFADGITTILVAARVPPAGGGVWLLVSGLASIVIGVLMWLKWPVSGELAIGILIGVKLLLDGVALVGVGTAAAAIAKTT